MVIGGITKSLAMGRVGLILVVPLLAYMVFCYLIIIPYVVIERLRRKDK